MHTFILLGDSLFQHAFTRNTDETGRPIGSFGPRLTDAYVRRLDVLNRGFSGYNTRQILSLLRERGDVLPRDTASRPRFLVILIGANDARLPDTPGGPQQHVPLVEFKHNLAKIVAEVGRVAQPERIVLITTPPVDERKTVAADSEKGGAGLRAMPRRTAVVTAEYAEAVRQVGAEQRVPVLDIWTAIMERAGGERQSDVNSRDVSSERLDQEGGGVGETTRWDGNTPPGSSAAPVNEVLQSYLHDGLHFSRQGYDLLYDELMALIGRLWPDQTPERLAMATPAWDSAGAWRGLLRRARFET